MKNFYETLFNNLGDVNYDYVKKELKHEHDPELHRREMTYKEHFPNKTKTCRENGHGKKVPAEERLLKAIFGEDSNDNVEILDTAEFLSPVKVIRDKSHQTGRVTTIVFWKDHTKTVVKQMESDPDDAYLAFCAAVTKKLFGSTDKAQKSLKKSLLDKTVKKEKISEKECLGDFDTDLSFNTFLKNTEEKDLEEKA